MDEVIQPGAPIKPPPPTPAPNKRRGQRAQSKHGAAGQQQVLQRQITQQTIPWANDKFRGATTSDDNGELLLETDNDNDNGDGKKE